MPTPPAGTIGSLDYTKEERQTLAKKSKNWECSICGKVSNKLLTGTTTTQALSQEECSFLKQISLKVSFNIYKYLVISALVVLFASIGFIFADFNIYIFYKLI